MSDEDQVTWRWLAGVVAALAMGVVGAWAHDVRTQLVSINSQLQDVVRHDVVISALSERVGRLERGAEVR